MPPVEADEMLAGEAKIRSTGSNRVAMAPGGMVRLT
jgi:hypothetical protein